MIYLLILSLLPCQSVENLFYSSRYGPAGLFSNVIIWLEAPCYSQLVTVINGWLWEYGVTSWGCKCEEDNMKMSL